MKNYFPILAIAIALSGCMKENGGNSDSNGKADGPVFDFSTSTGYVLNFQYDVPSGYVVGFDVYTEYPFETNASGQEVIKQGITPVEKGFTDKNGVYNKVIDMPSYVKSIYVFTSYAGVSPRLLVAKVENGQLQAAAPIKPENAPKSSQMTKAGGVTDYNTIQTNYFKNTGTSAILTLGKWHAAKEGSNPTTLANGNQVKLFGRPVEMSYADKSKFGADAAVNDVLPISAEVLTTINAALKGDGSGVAVDPKYLQSGDIKVSSETELDLIFIQNWAAYRNTLTYYCYETNNPPTSVSDIKHQVIALPNAMEFKLNIDLSSYYDVGSISKGEGVKLKYVDQNGNMHDKFPAGTSVGWVLYCDAYTGLGSAQNDYTMCPDLSKRSNYSNPKLSETPNTAILRHGDFVVVGFDDGDPKATGYRDYLDVMFNVHSSIPGAITPGVPDVDIPEQPEPVAVTKMGILLYEDLWPYQGDFDMNDIVVKYVAKTSKNINNEVTGTDVDFTIMHSGASFNNSFAYYDPNVSNASIEITGGNGASTIDKTNNIVRLANKVLNYANKPTKVIFTVKYKYNSPIPVSSYVGAPFNPFITVGDVSGSSSDIGQEVHLTNYAPTKVADMSWFEKKSADWSNPDLGLYYITYENFNPKQGEDKGQQLPFAVNIIFDNEATMNGFKVTQEGKNISKAYSGFNSWVSSNGSDNPDWYLHYSE